MGPAPRAERQSQALNRRDFFAAIVARLGEQLPPDLRGFRSRSNPLLLKVDYGNERVHFEVWPDAARQQLELGLHFEDGPASTVAYLAYFDRRIVEIKHLLGPEIELERWTLSWGHLFEVRPLQPLNRGFSRIIADRLADQIALLQPMVIDAAVLPEPRDRAAGTRGRWTRRKRE